MDQITREQKLFVAAAASVLFAISLFFDWISAPEVETLLGDIDVGVGGSGFDVLPAAWIYLVLAIVAALALLAEAFDYELPLELPAIPVATWLMSIPLVVSLSWLIDIPVSGGGFGRGIGLYLGFVFALIAVVAAGWAWRDERAYI